MILVTIGILCWLRRAHHIKNIFLNRIDNLHNHDNSIILIFIRVDTVQKPGNALIAQFLNIIERIKSHPSAQRATQNRNVGYTYFYSPNSNEINDIIINNYDKIQFHDIGNL